MIAAAAWLYAALAVVVALFQLALTLGAPWGHLAMGGRYPGRLPPGMRLAAIGQGVLIAFFAIVVLGRAGLTSPTPPEWLFWTVVGLSGLSALLNLITPSIPERRLWGPLALLMLLCAVRVAAG